MRYEMDECEAMDARMNARRELMEQWDPEPDEAPHPDTLDDEDDFCTLFAFCTNGVQA